MKSLSISDYQKVELNILKQIHDFCESRGITYFLYYGSLLGAIRHGGPIPWDDDIDIAMPRKDYDRFIREYEDSAEFRLYASERGNSVIRNARVCDVKQTEVKLKLKFTSEKTGVWVDVDALDGLYDDAQMEDWRRRRIRYYVGRMLESRRGLYWIRDSRTFGVMCKRIFKRLVFPLFRKRWLRQFYALIKRVDYETAQRCACLMVLTYGEREYIQKEWVSKRRLVDFAGIKVWVPAEAEKILESIYGDWRTPIRPDGEKYSSHYLSVSQRGA